MTQYPFKQGLDYGPRHGTLGLVLHMAEGLDGTLNYLAGSPARGVSANAVCLTDGTMWQMVDWSHASGSMNPAMRGPATGYYNTGVIQAVLGDHYVDPNAWSISIEIAGFRSVGPSAAQVASCIAWAKDMRSRFPTLRGAYGHADQTDTKGCPGTTPNMRAIFDGVGGHGLWAPPDPATEAPLVISDDTPLLVDLKVGDQLYDSAGAPLVKVSVAQTQHSPFEAEFGPTFHARGFTISTSGQTVLAFVHTSDVTTHPVPVPGEPLPPDAVACKPFSDAAAKTAVAADRAKAYVGWKP